MTVIKEDRMTESSLSHRENVPFDEVRARTLARLFRYFFDLPGPRETKNESATDDFGEHTVADSQGILAAFELSSTSNGPSKPGVDLLDAVVEEGLV